MGITFKRLILSKPRQSLVMLAGIVFLVLFLHLPHIKDPYHYTYWTSLLLASDTLRGNSPPTDLVQDIVGYKALINGGNLYPALSQASEYIGFEWNYPFASTHLPSTFLFAAPVAVFSWPVASAVWAWLMLLGLIFSYRLYGVPWRLSIGLAPFTLLWPPAAISLGQITVPWLFFTALAFSLRNRHEFWSGFCLGLGALLKVFPGLVLYLSILKKQWKPILGALLSGLSFLVVILILHPGALGQYINSNQTNIAINLIRCDNGSVLFTLQKSIGSTGVIIFGVLLAFFLMANLPLFQQVRIHSIDTWMFMVFMSIFLLPLAWDYSLLPTLPVVAWLFLKNRPLINVLCGLSILASSILPIVSCESSYLVTLSIVLLGLATSISTIRLKFQVN